MAEDTKVVLWATSVNLRQLNLAVKKHCAGLITETSSLEERYSPRSQETIRVYKTLTLRERAQLENWLIDPVEIRFAVSQRQDSAIGVRQAMYRWTDVSVTIHELDLDADSDCARRLQTEIQALVQLRHPNVVLFLGASVLPDACLVVTELLHGGTLAHHYACRRAQRTSGRPWLADRAQALEWALALARAVSYMHQSEPRVVHGGLQPDRLLLTSSGTLKVSGFADCSIGSATLPTIHSIVSSSQPIPRWGSASEHKPHSSPRRCRGCLLGDGEDSAWASQDLRSRAPTNVSGHAHGSSGSGDQAAVAVPRDSYRAPKQCRSAAVGIRPDSGVGDGSDGIYIGREAHDGAAADVHAMASNIWFMRTGRHPAHPSPPGAPAAVKRIGAAATKVKWSALAAVIAAAWAPDPAARPSAERLLELLEALRDGGRGCWAAL